MRNIVKIAFLILALARLATGIALANGGTFLASTVKSTGNLQYQRKPNIELQNEVLHVQLQEDWAEVEVTYTLLNRGGADTVNYGFPVDGSAGGLTKWQGESIPVFMIRDNGLAIETKLLSEEVKPAKKAKEINLTEQEYGQPVRSWYMARLTFTRHETKTLSVHYRVRCMGTSSGTSKSPFWSESPRLFTYTFKPAATWGSGKIGHLEIGVDISKLRAAQIPVNSVAPAGWQTENGTMRWIFDYASLEKMPDLAVSFDSEERQYHQAVQTSRVDRKWIQSIRVSSTHDPVGKTNYDARNLLDGKLDTAWMTQGKGVGRGEWIDVTFTHPIHLEAVGILNGALASAQALAEHGQVTQAEVQLHGRGSDWTRKEEVSKGEYNQSLVSLPGAQVKWVFEMGDGGTTAKGFRLTIKNAAPGSKHPQTAVSELYIIGREKRSDERD